MSAGESPSQRLTVELLEALKKRWEEHDAPILDALQPGLTDDQIDALMAPLGLALPDEARLWWTWHDGTRPGNHPGRWLGSYEYLRLSEAVELYEIRRRLMREFVEIGSVRDPDDWWNRQWFVITQTGAAEPIVCDCTVDPGAVTPIRVVDLAFRLGGPIQEAASLGEMVAGWIEQMDAGTLIYHAELEAWF